MAARKVVTELARWRSGRIEGSAVAFTQIKPDERKGSACAFLKAAVAYYASLGVKVERVMTDNGSCYRSAALGSADDLFKTAR